MILKARRIYRSLRVVLRILLRIYVRIRCAGADILPRGPKIYVVNHPTVYDLFPIMAFARTDFVHVLIEEQIWSFPLVRFLMHITNQVCLKTGDRFNKTLEDSLFLLRSGHSIVMSPEGGRTHPEENVRARKSIVRMVMESQVPVLPVGVWLPKRNIVIKEVHYDFQNRHYVDQAHFPKFRSAYGIVFGEPIDLSEYHGRELDPQTYQNLADNILSTVYTLSEKAKELVNPSPRSSF